VVLTTIEPPWFYIGTTVIRDANMPTSRPKRQQVLPATDMRTAQQRCEDRTVRRALRIIERRGREPLELMTKPSFVADWFRLRLSTYEREVFAVAWLDTQHRLVEFRELFVGTIDRAEVHLREVAKSALACNAAAGIFGHNHPSGCAEPSIFDLELTEYLETSLAGLGIAVIDHWIVTATAATSMFSNPYEIDGLKQTSRYATTSGAGKRGRSRTTRTRDE